MQLRIVLLLLLVTIPFASLKRKRKGKGHKETRCDDKKKRECPGWRNQGFCKESSKWYGYMKDNCKKSCGHCARERETFSAIKKKVCKNLETDKQCATWKNSKFCDEDHEYHSYMKKNCEKTCGFCVSSVKEEEKEDKVVATVATKVECKDTETAAQCLDWKNLGYCKSTSEYNGYMKKSCSKTCGFCVSTSTTTTSASCKDDYDTEKCKQWAEIGECEENPAWMKTNCKKSCDKCSDGSSSGTGTGTSGTSGTGTGTSGSSGTGTGVTQEKDKATTTINDVYCGLRIKLRVVGGEDAKFGEWPWQIAIANKLTPTKLLCGGSLINKQWVVTASHCFGSPNSNKYSPKDLVVRIGDHNIKLKEGPEIVSDISMIIRHEGYTYGSYNHDITLLKLAKPIEYNQNIKPICLPQPKVAEKTNQVCFVTGWGRVAEYGKTSDVLQEAKVPIVKRDTCQKTVGLISTFSNNMLCAGYEKGGIDACQGDSGGPLVCDNGGRFELVGVVSWGRGCARENSYGVYTKVSNYIDWIKKNIQK